MYVTSKLIPKKEIICLVISRFFIIIRASPWLKIDESLPAAVTRNTRGCRFCLKEEVLAKGSFLVTSRHASWHRGHQRSSFTPVCHWPASGRAPAEVHVLHFRFHSSLPGCLWSSILPLSLWGPVECNFGDGVGVLAQHVPNPVPSLPGDDGLHILLLAPS